MSASPWREALGTLAAFRQAGPARTALLLACTALLAWSGTLRSLVPLWREQFTYSHWWVVAPLATGWLVWSYLREQTPLLPGWRSGPSPLLAAALCLGAALAWLGGAATGIGLAEYAGAWLALVAAFALAMGPQFQPAILPLLLLATVVPVWSLLTIPLVKLTIAVNTTLLSLTGLTAIITAGTVQLPAGTLQIAEGCSGLNFALTGIIIGLLLGEVLDASLRRRIVLLGMSLAAALVANWARVFLLILIGDATDLKHRYFTEDHLTFGWVVYGLTFVPVFWFAARARDTTRPAVAPSPAPPARGARVRAVAAVTFLGLAGLAWQGIAYRVAHHPVAVLACPAGTSPAGGPAPGEWRPRFPGAADTRWCSTGEATLYRNAYGGQARGAELVGEDSHFSPPDWTEAFRDGSADLVTLRVAAPDGSTPAAIAYRYVVGKQQTPSRLRAQLAQPRALLMASRIGIDLVHVPCVDDCAAAERRAREVLSGL